MKFKKRFATNYGPTPTEGTIYKSGCKASSCNIIYGFNKKLHGYNEQNTKAYIKNITKLRIKEIQIEIQIENTEPADKIIIIGSWSEKISFY